MLKVLRKYNKFIIAVGMSLLLVAFLLPQAIQQFGHSPRNVTVARMGTSKISAMELGRAGQEAAALDLFNPGLVQALGMEKNAADAHWFLLTREAERAGLVGDSTDGLQLIDLLAGETASQLVQRGNDTSKTYQGWFDMARAEYMKRRNDAAGKTGMTLEEFDRRVLARARAFFRLQQQVMSVARVSDRRAIARAARELDSATFDYVLLTSPFAPALDDPAPEPTDADLRALFEENKNNRRGEGELGIGYTEPERLKLEWMTLSRGPIATAVVLDPIETNKHWRQNRTLYPGEWAEERERVEGDLRRARVDDVMAEADRVVRAEVKRALQAVDKREQFYVLPDDWASRRPTSDAIAQAIVDAVKSKFEIDIPLPTVERRDSAFRTRLDLSAELALAGSGLTQGSQSVRTLDAIFSAKELENNSPNPFRVQVGVTMIEPSAMTRTGDRVYVTLLDARKPSPPDDWEERRALVTQDWKDLRGYRSLQGEMDFWKQIAVEDGLDAVVAAARARTSGVSIGVQRGSSATASGTRTSDRDVDADEKVRDAIMGVANSMDPTVDPTTIPAEARTIVVPVPRARAVMVAQVTRRSPLTDEQVRRFASAAAAAVNNTELSGALEQFGEGGGPYSYASLAKKYDFVPVRGAGTPDPGEPGSSEPAPSEEAPAGA
ncbi:MAG: hypothetical protein RBS39_03080 [Phycisphaerales bacterium]|jgi:hypothetical protein|nr:hypothetical protein [Phycisphaerales bacterium]